MGGSVVMGVVLNILSLLIVLSYDATIGRGAARPSVVRAGGGGLKGLLTLCPGPVAIIKTRIRKGMG